MSDKEITYSVIPINSWIRLNSSSKFAGRIGIVRDNTLRSNPNNRKERINYIVVEFAKFGKLLVNLKLLETCEPTDEDFINEAFIELS